MTHVNNIAHILRFGITHFNSVNRNLTYKPIGDSSLISSRNRFQLPNGKMLGEYIPFYFGRRMPMLYVIQKGFNGVTITPAEEIVYCITSVQNIIDRDLNFVFFDGHAKDSLSTFFEKDKITEIESLLDFKAIKALQWTGDTDMKRRKEAELLLVEDLPAEAILGYIVYNSVAEDKLLGLGVNKEIIAIRPGAYF